MPRLLLLPLLAIATLLLSFGSTSARPVDTVSVIQTASGIPYICCYTFSVTNRHTDTTVQIQEVRMRIVSGPASFDDGSTSSPLQWTLVGQTSREIIFYSNTASADIHSGETRGTFNFCVRDTGVFRMVWETYSIDSLLSRDTLTYACHGKDCDESFFRVQPSNIAAIVAIDIVRGNPLGSMVNDFHLHPIGTARFTITAPILAATGWLRTRTRVDTVSWETVTHPLRTIEEFAEGFRVQMNGVPRDSNYRIEWWTTSFGQLLCRDTATLRWGLARRDTVRMLPVDNCCRDLRVRNTHTPSSPITTVVVRLTTPGAQIVDTLGLPANWKVSAFNTARDSMAFTLAAGLPFDSAAIFSGLCVDNKALSSDSVRLRVETWAAQGVPIDTNNFLIVCPRPLTRCDSVWVQRVDSSQSGTRRCVTVALRNMNSRTITLQTLTLHFTNPGARRRVVDAQAPPGWNLGSFGGDSARFVAGFLLPGETTTGFIICLDNSDTTADDPVSMTWTTGEGASDVCNGVVTFNAGFRPPVIRCDSVWLTAVPTIAPLTSCFRLHIANHNTTAQTVNRVGVTVDFSANTAFNGADANAPWTADYGGVFPTFNIAYAGGEIAPNSIDSSFEFCLDTRLLQTLPASIPVRWSTLNGSTTLCTGTIQARIDTVVTAMDSDRVVLLSSFSDDFCGYNFALQNTHTPAGSLDLVAVSIESGQGRILDADAHGTNATGWSAQPVTSDSITFAGGTLATGAQLDTLTLQIDSSNGLPITLRFDSYTAGTLVSQRRITVQCDVSDVAVAGAAALTLAQPQPNPARDRVRIPFSLAAPSQISLTLSASDGRVVRSNPTHLFAAGAQSIELDVADLPAGVYYATVEGGGMRAVRSVVLLR